MNEERESLCVCVCLYNDNRHRSEGEIEYEAVMTVRSRRDIGSNQVIFQESS